MTVSELRRLAERQHDGLGNVLPKTVQQETLDALLACVEALERIAHFPWNVNTSAEADLRDVKELARAAVAALDGEQT